MPRNLSVIEPSVKAWDPAPILNVYAFFLTAFTIAGNATLLLFIIKSRFKLMKPNLFILSLTASDFLTGLIVAPLCIYTSFYCVTQVYCDVYLTTSQVLARNSSITIMAISIDRFMKLSHPIKYKTNWSSTRRRAAIIASIWTFSVAVSVIKVTDSVTNSGNYNKGCFFRESYSVFEQLELIVTLVCSNIVALIFYIKIILFVRSPAIMSQLHVLIVAKKNSLKFGESKTESHELDSDPSLLRSESKHELRRHYGRYTPALKETSISCKPSRPSFILGLIVVLNFFFVALPPFIFSLFISCELCINEMLFQAVPWIFWNSCAVNPVIFAALNSEFQTYIRSFFFKGRA